jgi:hypothetical protein
MSANTHSGQMIDGRYLIVFTGAYSRISTRSVFMPRAGHNLCLGLSTISQDHFAAVLVGRGY